MNHGNNLVLLPVLILELYALCIIFLSLVGNNQNGQVEEKEDFHALRPGTPHVNKIILVVVDAMRYDFVPQMPFIQRILTDGDNACIFKVKASGPTVTLPRIKALVTGTTSSYWDFLANLKQSSGLSSDNVISKAKQAGKKIVFYGDDTWLKLFPGSEFIRAEGVSSFFVTDFYEVDSNVTRNVEQEINSFDFDLMILHYLGVDHVGHVHGPKHSLIPSKLQEMSEVLKMIYDKLKQVPSVLPNIILLTGDHGMANQGGHGGDSYNEVITPLIVITVGQNDTHICKSPPRDWYELPYETKQIDIVSLLSFLWDLPFPSNSKGVIPTEIISQFNLSIRLEALQRNSRQLLKFLSEDEPLHLEIKERFNDLSQKLSLNDSVVTLASEFQLLLQELKRAAVVDIEHDVLGMVFGIATLAFGITLHMLARSLNNTAVLLVHAILIVGFIISFVIPISIPLCIIIASVYLFSNRSVFNFQPLLTSVTFTNAVYLACPLLFFSSSFVEEEHFLLYYLYSSVIIVGIIQGKSNTRFFLIIPFLLHRICSSLNATGQKWNNEWDLNDYLKEMDQDKKITVIAGVLVFAIFCHNLLQKLSVTLVMLYKLQVFSLVVQPQLSHWEAKCCYAFILLCGISKGRKLFTCWMLLTLLLQRPENSILVPLIALQMKFVDSSGTCEKLRGLLFNLLFFTSFYYQGNSNHITTIDISLGYTGLSEYNEMIVGLLTFLSTFSLPIMVIIYVLDESVKKDGVKIQSIVMELLVLRVGLTNLIYAIVVTLMRQHLFIWSVFVPKLLYLIAFTFLIAIIQMCVMITSVVVRIQEPKIKHNEK